MIELDKIHCGNCESVMQDIDSNSVDCIVTDPPYGLSFMGKNWDKAVPSIAIWQECLRVLKPGAFAFVMCIPRQDCLARMICRLEDAGFNVAFSSIYWTYASGFPKAQNLSKAADKRNGRDPDNLTVRNYLRKKREIIGKAKSGIGTAIRNGAWSGLPAEEFNITIPALKQAKVLDGAYGGFQPKPAVEIIIVAMKPLSERTYTDQAIANGHGCTWLDECRIPYENAQIEDLERGRKRKEYTFNKVLSKVDYKCPNARFPANVLCESNVLSDGIERKTGNVNPHSEEPSVFTSSNVHTGTHKGDTGSYSRYFSLDSWWDERIKSLPIEAQKTFPWLIVPKASKSEKNRGLEDISNTHATVKPIKVMSWLITLASREGDIVLDPFCGSGTTLIAAKLLGRQYIGIEREEEYCEIACKRVAAIPTRLDRY